ncbi:MAG: hypothetical protein M1814_003930 [Vezdaea aestivalis]|nr:MAG: hypothetical protein M1814_003930 [Vezdaea aestivalis]
MTGSPTMYGKFCPFNERVNANPRIKTIAFWEEYLEREHLSKFPGSHITLLRPSMCMMIKHTPDPLSLKEALPDFRKTTHIFLPINDCNDSEAVEGGTHWSLLLVSKRDGVAFHYDSLSGMNDDHAEKVTEKISILLDIKISFIGLMDSPQQMNYSDCGVFVCMEMEHLLLKRLLSAAPNESVKMSFGAKEINAPGGRTKMLKRINELRKEGQRRRSRSRSPGMRASRSKSPPRIE